MLSTTAASIAATTNIMRSHGAIGLYGATGVAVRTPLAIMAWISAARLSDTSSASISISRFAIRECASFGSNSYTAPSRFVFGVARRRGSGAPPVAQSVTILDINVRKWTTEGMGALVSRR